MRTFRPPLDCEDIEAHGVGSPQWLLSQEKLSGTNNPALLAPGHGTQRSAEIAAAALAHLDHGQYLRVETDQIEFAGLAAQIAGQYFETVSVQIVGGELFGVHAAALWQMRHAGSMRPRLCLNSCIGGGFMPKSASEAAHRARASGSVLQSASMPAKQHHTPEGFRNNYTGSVTKSFGDFLRWQVNRIRQRLPPAPTLPTPRAAADLDFVKRNAGGGRQMIPAVTWIGHATALVQASGLNVLTDPIFSSRASPVQFLGPVRAQPPGISIQDLPRIDLVVISHNHYDHLDRGSVRALADQPGGEPLFLAPLGIKAWLEGLGIRRAIELDWWEHHIHEGAGGPVEFHFAPAQHWSGRSLRDRNKTLWGAWAVFGADFHWFFTGDTGYSQDFSDARQRYAARQSLERGGGFDIALIAVGACLPRWFMKMQHVDLEEAVQVHLDLGAKRSLGVHWGTFALADDPLDQPLHELAAARNLKGVPEESFFLLPVGGTRQFARRTSA